MLTERQRGNCFAKVEPEPNTGCWVWTAALLTTGYGHFRERGDGGVRATARKYGVDKQVIQRIRKGEIWRSAA